MESPFRVPKYSHRSMPQVSDTLATIRVFWRIASVILSNQLHS